MSVGDWVLPVSAIADRPMSITGFLDWEPGDGRRYQLIGGRPVAMAPGSQAHGTLVAAIGGEIRNHLKGSLRCRVVSEAGIIPQSKDHSYFIADLAVSCVPHARKDIATPEPLLIIEVLSPGTEAEDRTVKVPAYQTIPSVREIVLVAQGRAEISVLRRAGEWGWIADDIAGLDQSLRLDGVDLALPLAELYRGLDLEPVGST